MASKMPCGCIMDALALPNSVTSMNVPTQRENLTTRTSLLLVYSSNEGSHGRVEEIFPSAASITSRLLRSALEQAGQEYHTMAASN